MKVTLSSKLRKALLAVLISSVAIATTSQAALFYVDKTERQIRGSTYKIASSAWGGNTTAVGIASSGTSKTSWSAAISISNISVTTGNTYVATLNSSASSYTNLEGIGYNYNGTALTLLLGGYNFKGSGAATAPWISYNVNLTGITITSDTVLTFFWNRDTAGTGTLALYYSIDGGESVNTGLFGDAGFGSAANYVTAFNIGARDPAANTWTPSGTTSAGNFDLEQFALYTTNTMTSAEMNRYSAIQIGDVVRGTYSMVAGDTSMTFEGMTAAGNLTVNSGNSATFKAAAGGQLAVTGTGNVTVQAGATAAFDKVTMASTGTLTLNGDTAIAGTSTLANVTQAATTTLTVNGDTTIAGASTLAYVTMAKTAALTVTDATNITGNAVLYNVNLGSGATIVLSGAANSIETITGDALGNTVSLAAGSTKLAGTASNVTFAVLDGAEFNVNAGVSTLADSAVTTNLAGITTAVDGAIVTVNLTSVFMANILGGNPDPNTSFTLDTIEFLNFSVDELATITINLVVDNGYTINGAGSIFIEYTEPTSFAGGTSVTIGGANFFTMTYVPEPTTATLGVLGLAGLLLRRRRATR